MALEAVLGGLGGSSGGIFWQVLSGLGRSWGGSWGDFLGHRGGLGGFWLPNASWEAIWGDPGNQDGSKLKPKMGPSWSQKGIKIDAQIA